MLTYIFRKVPSTIFYFILKHSQTTLITTSANNIFQDILVWLEEKGYSKKLRSFKLTNEKYTESNEFIKSVGYGDMLLREFLNEIKRSYYEKIFIF